MIQNAYLAKTERTLRRAMEIVNNMLQTQGNSGRFIHDSVVQFIEKWIYICPTNWD